MFRYSLCRFLFLEQVLPSVIYSWYVFQRFPRFTRYFKVLRRFAGFFTYFDVLTQLTLANACRVELNMLIVLFRECKFASCDRVSTLSLIYHRTLSMRRLDVNCVVTSLKSKYSCILVDFWIVLLQSRHF
jgi:hypothetical protein